MWHLKVLKALKAISYNEGHILQKSFRSFSYFRTKICTHILWFFFSNQENCLPRQPWKILGVVDAFVVAWLITSGSGSLWLWLVRMFQFRLWSNTSNKLPIKFTKLCLKCNLSVFSNAILRHSCWKQWYSCGWLISRFFNNKRQMSPTTTPKNGPGIRTTVVFYKLEFLNALV